MPPATGPRGWPPRLPPAFPPDVQLIDQLGTAAALCVERAIVDAILCATSVAGVPAYRDLFPSAR
nr:hypothetical protein [Nocardia brasiliensis]